MKQRYPSDDLARFLLRMPGEMRDELKRRARAHDRSANGEILALIKQGIAAETKTASEHTA